MTGITSARPAAAKAQPRFSRSLWLAFRRPVKSHLRGGAIASGLLVLLALLPAGGLRSTLLALALAAWLYFAQVLVALGCAVWSLPGEWRRKGLHLASGAAIVGLFVGTGSAAATALLCAVLLAWSLASTRLSRYKLLHQLSLDRRDGTRSAGEWLFPLALGALALWAGTPQAAWLAAALVLVLSDAAAALVGKRFGRHGFAVPGGHKSLEGCAAFALCTYAALMAAAALAGVPPPDWRPAVALTFALTLVEALSARGSDNVSLPLAAYAGWQAWIAGVGVA